MRGIQYSPLAESPAAHQQLTDNQRCPSLGEDFSCLGDRAELTVVFIRHPSSAPFIGLTFTPFPAYNPTIPEMRRHASSKLE